VENIKLSFNNILHFTYTNVSRTEYCLIFQRVLTISKCEIIPTYVSISFHVRRNPLDRHFVSDWILQNVQHVRLC